MVVIMSASGASSRVDAVRTVTLSGAVPETLSRTATGDVVPTAAERAEPRAFDPDPVIAWAGTAAITFLAAFLRLWNLDYPKKFLFDETYYAKDAWSLVHHGYVTGYVADANDKILAGDLHGLWTSDPSMVVHPEVGKWLIGSAELVAGMTPFGWRLAPAIVGSLMVMVMIRLARRVTGSTLLGLVAGILMCFDGLQLVLSRLALLDIFEAFFVLCAVSCLVADRDWFRARLARAEHVGDWGPRVLWRPWLLLAGLWWGLAIGTKWSAVFPMAAFGLMFWIWSAGGRRSFGVRWALVKSALLDAAPGLLHLVVLPVVIYIATWTGWLLHANVYEQHLSNTQYGPYWGSYHQHDAHGFFPELFQSLRSLWHYHHDVYMFHTKFLNDSTHVYQSNPLGWPILNRPVGVDAQLNITHAKDAACTATGSQTCLRQVLLLGTPALWWFSTIALIWSAVCWVGKRDWRYGLVVVGALVTWLPWLRYDDRPIFSYYAVVIEPFLILGAVMLLGEILGRAPADTPRRTVGAVAAGTVVVAVIVNFAWFWPIYTDGLLTQGEWIQRIWFRRWI
jgi:dolichyl-phosphate-mannose-protein mannosyltransferase